jgi:ATP-dependent helicase HrpB
VRTASRVEREWLVPAGVRIEHAFHAETARVRAVERSRCGEIVLAERPVPPDPRVAAELLAEELRRRGLDPRTEALLRRASFAGIVLDREELVRRACAGCTALAQVDVPRQLSALRDTLDRGAPETLPLPSGRRARLDYQADGSVAASVKLQELFGLAATPRLGPRDEPVTLVLLAPNGRPVQTTRDLRSFWDRTYPEVRRELRGRYPRHPWPDDPWSARPTAAPGRRRIKR